MQNLSLSFLDNTTPTAVSKLASAELLILLKQLADLESCLKKRKTILEDGLSLKFGQIAQAALQMSGRNTGTVRFADHDYTIVANLPKKIIWEQDKLFDILQKIPPDQRKQYVKTTYVVDERKYLSWSEGVKNLFDPARTVQTSKPKFQITNGGNN